MARAVVDQAALRKLVRDPGVQRAIRAQVVDPISEESLADVPVDTGTLRDSHFVEAEEGVHRIGFDTDYAALVHEGDGVGKNSVPRPFLARAALRDRGEIR